MLPLQLKVVYMCVVYFMHFSKNRAYIVYMFEREKLIACRITTIWGIHA